MLREGLWVVVGFTHRQENLNLSLKWWLLPLAFWSYHRRLWDSPTPRLLFNHVFLSYGSVYLVSQILLLLVISYREIFNNLQTHNKLSLLCYHFPNTCIYHLMDNTFLQVSTAIINNITSIKQPKGSTIKLHRRALESHCWRVRSEFLWSEKE